MHVGVGSSGVRFINIPLIVGVCLRGTDGDFYTIEIRTSRWPGTKSAPTHQLAAYYIFDRGAIIKLKGPRPEPTKIGNSQLSADFS